MTYARTDSSGWCHSGWVDWDHEPQPYGRLAAHAAGQWGLVTRSDARELGIPDSTLEDWVRTGRLTLDSPCVYRVVGVRDGWHQRALGAVLSADPYALLSHRAAAALHGLAGFRPGNIEITAPRWLRRPRPWVVGHESLDLASCDRATREGIPVTTVVRTLIDLGAVSPPRLVAIALDDARRRGLVSLTTVARRNREVAKRGRRGVGTMRRLLAERAELDGGPTSPTETLLFELIVAYGLELPVTQFKIVLPSGEVVYLDFAYPDRLLALEADSEKHHLDLESFHYDRWRQNHLELLGWRFLRFTQRHIRQDPGGVARQIGAALRFRR